MSDQRTLAQAIAEVQLIEALKGRIARLTRLVEVLESGFKEAIEELKPYAFGKRDQSFDGWQKEWRHIEIENEFDYEHYPNHVDKEMIQRFENILSQRREIMGESSEEGKK